jgi:hypothetical protein
MFDALVTEHNNGKHAYLLCHLQLLHDKHKHANTMPRVSWCNFLALFLNQCAVSGNYFHQNFLHSLFHGMARLLFKGVMEFHEALYRSCGCSVSKVVMTLTKTLVLFQYAKHFNSILCSESSKPNLNTKYKSTNKRPIHSRINVYSFLLSYISPSIFRPS